MIKRFLKNNKIIIFLFLFSTLFFIYQRFSGGIHWDFALYVLNAKYLFSDGFYFEFWVPPFMPFLLGVFSIFGWILAEYIFIIFVSLLFLFSCLKFSETFNLDKKFFYVCFINSYLIYYGLRNGTELLSLSFLILFFAYLFKKGEETKSSFFLSLSFLTRYNNIFLLPLILLRKNIKIIIYSFLIFFAVLTPWLLFNYFTTGNPLASIADYFVFIYLQRLYYGDRLMESISLVIVSISILITMVLRKKLRKILSIQDASMIFLLLLVIVTFLNMPFKNPRYLFNISLPLIYFFVKFTKKFKKLLYFIIILNIFTILSLVPNYYSGEDIVYRNLKIKENCTIMSNVWVYLNYHGIPSEPYPFKELMNKKIDEGYRILLFKWVKEPDYSSNETFFSQFPIIENTSSYIIIGNSSLCKGFYKINMMFKERKNEFFITTQNKTIRDEINCNNNVISKALCDILKI